MRCRDVRKELKYFDYPKEEDAPTDLVENYYLGYLGCSLGEMNNFRRKNGKFYKSLVSLGIIAPYPFSIFIGGRELSEDTLEFLYFYKKGIDEFTIRITLVSYICHKSLIGSKSTRSIRRYNIGELESKNSKRFLALANKVKDNYRNFSMLVEGTRLGKRLSTLPYDEIEEVEEVFTPFTNNLYYSIKSGEKVILVPYSLRLSIDIPEDEFVDYAWLVRLCSEEDDTEARELYRVIKQRLENDWEEEDEGVWKKK